MSDTEVTTLAGLRRLVLHARDMLVPTPAPGGYDSAAVRQWAAALVARSVLTLVADCLPGQGLTEDQATQLQADTDAQITAMEAKVLAATQRAEDAAQEGFDTVSAHVELESTVADLLGLDADADDIYAAVQERIVAQRAAQSRAPGL